MAGKLGSFFKLTARTAVVAAAFGAALGAARAQAQEDVILRLNFTPWAMHAQYYAALKQGFYKDEGLDVEIRPAASGQQNEALIASGREHFGVGNADTFIKAVSAGLPVIAVMADQPDTPLSIISLEKNNITKPEDMKGKKLAWFPTNVRGLVEPIFKAGGFTSDDVEFVNVGRGSEQQLLVAGGVDAIYGFFYGQALTLEHMGYPTTYMRVRDYGAEFMGNVIYTNKQLAEENPELVTKFLRATMRGLIWTKDNMDQAMDYIIEVSPDRNHGLEVRKLEMIYDFYNTPQYEDYFGKMTDAKWKSSIETLASTGSLDRVPEPGEMYTNKFIKDLEVAKELSDLIRKQGS